MHVILVGGPGSRRNGREVVIPNWESGETQGPSTALRSGRDDRVISLGSRWQRCFAKGGSRSCLAAAESTNYFNAMPMGLSRRAERGCTILHWLQSRAKVCATQRRYYSALSVTSWMS